MRTTVTFDDDVAVRLRRILRSSGAGLKRIINTAMRIGLEQMESRPAPPKHIEMPKLRPRNCSLSNVDNVSEVLAIIEGDTYK